MAGTTEAAGTTAGRTGMTAIVTTTVIVAEAGTSVTTVGTDMMTAIGKASCGDGFGARAYVSGTSALAVITMILTEVAAGVTMTVEGLRGTP